MNNLLTSTQIQAVDAYTIVNEPISSINLMERAATAFVDFFKVVYPKLDPSISILCGPGNNGGDGLAIARLLRYGHNTKYKSVSVYLINFSNEKSNEYTKNLSRLPKLVKQFNITEPEQLKSLQADLIIDAVLGSGLNKPLSGKYAELAAKVNALNKTVIAVDMPTGFPGEGVIDENYNGIKADLVISFQRPKINFFFPESTVAIDQFKVVNIGLDEDFIASMPSDWKLITKPVIKIRKNFTHKGTYGHALITAGDTTTMGAALLAAQACLNVGTGLTTLCLPESGSIAANIALPEVMTLPQNHQIETAVLEKFTAIAIGPGLGAGHAIEDLLAHLIDQKKPMVIDAEALNILAKRKKMFDKLPEQTILTPHVKEFDRLFGPHQTWWARIETAKKEAQRRKLIIVLKNQYTFVCLPTGEVHINQTGNPAMASGGMGDVLTGMIVGFLAQSYSSADAATLAVYVHGKAGNELAKKRFTVSASQVAKRIPKTLIQLTKLERASAEGTS